MIKQELMVDGRRLPYRVRLNARRKTRVMIQILPDGSVQVDAPLTTNLLALKRLVRGHAEQLLLQIAEIESRQGFVLPLAYTAGERHFYLGRQYPLYLQDNAAATTLAVSLSETAMQVATKDRAPETVRTILRRWYRQQAQTVFRRRLDGLSRQVPWLTCTPELKLRRMQRRWGSCSSRGGISLNTHLIKAGMEHIDYVILHELCHVREHNHSPRFYRLMDQVLPAWRARKTELDEMAALIVNE